MCCAPPRCAVEVLLWLKRIFLSVLRVLRMVVVRTFVMLAVGLGVTVISIEIIVQNILRVVATGREQGSSNVVLAV